METNYILLKRKTEEIEKIEGKPEENSMKIDAKQKH